MPIKTFQNGFPLPASDLNTYLMNQSVMTFASSTARAAAITTPNEGMLTWLEDTNTYQYYTGSAWADLLPNLAAYVTLTGTQTLTNKTLDSQHLTGSASELTTIVGTGFAGYTFDAATAADVLITANSTANGTVNIRGNSTTTLASLLAVGETKVINLRITNGSTAYYPNAWQIDGSAVTPKWQGGTAPTGGNASATDFYTVAITKTAATPTYSVFASQTKFA